MYADYLLCLYHVMIFIDLMALVCDECSIRYSCPLLEKYIHSKEHFRDGDIDELYNLYNFLELHEAYVSEMRKNILSRLVKMREI